MIGSCRERIASLESLLWLTDMHMASSVFVSLLATLRRLRTKKPVNHDSSLSGADLITALLASSRREELELAETAGGGPPPGAGASTDDAATGAVWVGVPGTNGCRKDHHHILYMRRWRTTRGRGKQLFDNTVHRGLRQPARRHP